jgi:hypothetical protein
MQMIARNLPGFFVLLFFVLLEIVPCMALGSASHGGYTAENSYPVGRRRPGRGGALETFQHNLDLFAGPAYQAASGKYLDDLSASLSLTNTKNFLPPRTSLSTSFITVAVGAQYRYLPSPKDKGILGLISYAAGISYQRRGYTYKLEKTVNQKNVSGNELILKVLSVENKVRANFLSVPLSVRFGRQVYAEAGVSFDFLFFGRSKLLLDNSTAFEGEKTENPGIIDGFAPAEMIYGLNQVMPFVSPSVNISAGYCFNEFIGMRVAGNFNPTFFQKNSNVDNTNFSSTIFSVQLIGGINK